MPLPWLTFVNVRTTEAARRAAQQGASLETLANAEEATTLVAGGRQTRGALPVKTEHFEAAVYSSRGRGYARYNEDGAGLFTDGRGQVYAAVFDQAGGLGGTVRGAASGLAAETAFRAFRKLAAAPANTDIPSALRAAIDEAHRRLVERAEGEVTTAVLAVFSRGRTVLINSGDSAAMRFDPTGTLQAVTEKHEIQTPAGIGCLVHAVGLTPEGPAPDMYEWPFAAGHWVIMASDGLLDSGLDPSAVGRILSDAKGPEQAVNRLARQTLRRMTLLQAKPDNLTILAVRAR